MKKHFLSALFVLFLIAVPFSLNANASPGGLDSNGGHTCRTNCGKYGLKTGQYHYHNADGTISVTKPVKSSLTIYINGVKQSYDQPPVIDNNRTLVPLRGIFENLGATVNWDQKTQTVTAIQGSKKIVLKMGSKSPVVNGKVVPIDVPAKTVNNRTLVPLRFIGEALGATVNFDSKTNMINITASN